MEKTGANNIIIIGAGIAGASAAYFLTQKGVRNVVILERENVAGAQSSGRNAAILRSAMPDSSLRRLGRESARFYRELPDGFSNQPLLRRVGLYLVARAEHAESLLSWAFDNKEEDGAELVDPAEMYARIPIVAPGLTTVLHQADEGVLDIHAILQSFLSGACRRGAKVTFSCDVTGLRTDGKRIIGVETQAGPLDADQVVMAGGGWAADLAEKAGFPLPLVPYRRHLLVTNPLPQVDPQWPVVWCEGDEFYFRPESSGLLMCGCDTVPVNPKEGQTTNPAEVEKIAVKAARWLPSLSDAGVARAWAGMRTFAPDHRFVIGPDPRIRGLHWLAGLGGHGMTCAPAVGQIAADWIAEGVCNHPVATALLPARLLDSNRSRNGN